jgi:shikimate dehydrogenase
MHEAALAHVGLAGGYERLEAIDALGWRARTEELLRGARDGVNVTLPWKLEAARICERLEGVAARLGAVNTIAIETRGGRPILTGHNTDVPGLVAALRARWPLIEAEVARARVLVVGAGGAAYAAVLAAHELRAGRVLVWNRTAARAREMVDAIGLGEVVEGGVEGAGEVALVLQAGSHGMGAQGPELEAATGFARFVLAATRAPKVMDLVYRPRPTAWVRAAAQLGAEAEDGLPMLVHQAALAFAIWTGAEAAPLVGVMRAAAEAELAKRAGEAPGRA